MANPALSSVASGAGVSNLRNAASPFAQDDSAVKGVMRKTGLLFTVLVPVALAAAYLLPPQLLNIASITAALLGLVVIFAAYALRTASPALAFLYAAIEGVFVGAASVAYNQFYDGVVTTALAATLATTAGVVILNNAGIVRTSGRARKVFTYLLVGYLIFSLGVLVASLLGFHLLTLGSPLSLAVSVFGVGMASFSLLTDVEDARSLAPQVEEREQWRLALGLVVSLVWLYVEMLRLFTNLAAIFSDD